jgi:hypothetical protein
MDTYLIEITDSKAYKLLKNLEELNIIKVLKKNRQEKAKSEVSSTARFRGALKLTDVQYKDFQTHAREIRNEWPDTI